MATFNCPNCKTAVEATERESYWGVKWPSCGVGFIPVERKTRERGNRASEPAWLVGMVWAFGTAAAVALAFVAWPLTVALLLALIAWQVWRMANTRATRPALPLGAPLPVRSSALTGWA